MNSGLVMTAWVVTVVVVYAALSVHWTSRSSGWYASLPRPSWQPPDVVFAIIWPLNFLALTIVGLLMAWGTPPAATFRFAATLSVSVVFALIWAYQFYVPHRLAQAAVSLACAAVLTWGLVGLAGAHQWWWGVLLVPYALWMTVATTLAFGYAHLVAADRS